MKLKCRACNNESEGRTCSDVCEEIMNQAKERIVHQGSLFDQVLDNVKKNTCNDCGGERKKYTQYCTECKKKRRRKRNSDYGYKMRDKRLCKNEACKKEIINAKSNSQRYCSDECKPMRTYDVRQKQVRIETKNRVKASVNKDIYEGTIDPKWLRRGTLSFVSKQSETGGAFIY